VDVIAALSKVADVTRPGLRDQLPVGAVVLTVAGLVAAGAPQRVPTVAMLVSAVGKLSGVGLTLFILGLIAASVLLQPLLSTIDDLQYGDQRFWWLGWLMKRLRSRQIRRYMMYRTYLANTSRLRAEWHDHEVNENLARAASALRRYPQREEDLRPTLLGNVVLAGEINAGRRYGLETLVVFPRLEPLLPDGIARRVAGYRSDLRFAVRLTSALIVAAAVSIPLLLPPIFTANTDLRDFLWFLVPAGALLLAWASHHNSVSAALQYYEALAVAFDLNRFALYDALHLPMPNDFQQELEFAREINYALSTGSVRPLAGSLTYEHPKSAE
jgi:hypothetical protein